MITPKWQFVDQDQANIQLQKLVDIIDSIGSNLNLVRYNLENLFKRESSNVEKVYVDARVNLYGVQAIINELIETPFPKLELTPELEPVNDD